MLLCLCCCVYVYVRMYVHMYVHMYMCVESGVYVYIILCVCMNKVKEEMERHRRRLSQTVLSMKPNRLAWRKVRKDLEKARRSAYRRFALYSGTLARANQFQVSFQNNFHSKVLTKLLAIEFVRLVEMAKATSLLQFIVQKHSLASASYAFTHRAFGGSADPNMAAFDALTLEDRNEENLQEQVQACVLSTLSEWVLTLVTKFGESPPFKDFSYDLPCFLEYLENDRWKNSIVVTALTRVREIASLAREDVEQSVARSANFFEEAPETRSPAEKRLPKRVRAHNASQSVNWDMDGPLDSLTKANLKSNASVRVSVRGANTHLIDCGVATRSVRRNLRQPSKLAFEEDDLIRIISSRKPDNRENGEQRWFLGWVVGPFGCQRSLTGWVRKDYLRILAFDKSLTLTHLLQIPVGISHFSHHLVREYSIENLHFWMEGRAFRQLPQKFARQKLAKDRKTIIRKDEMAQKLLPKARSICAKYIGGVL